MTILSSLKLKSSQNTIKTKYNNIIVHHRSSEGDVKMERDKNSGIYAAENN